MGVVAAGTSLRNGFAYDDVPIIVENARVHAVSPPWTLLGQGYWPSGSALAYRPATTWLFSLQWAIGGGDPTPFHWTNLLLYLGTVVILYGVAAAMLPRWAAWFGAAVFAVHPVHVEAVGNIVGQSELVVGLAALLALWLYLSGRGAAGFSPGRRLVIAGVVCWGALAKEQGILIPGILLLAEAVLVRRPGSFPARLRETRSLWGVLAVVLIAILVLRWAALGGVTGGMEAIAFSGVGPPQRLLTMLGIVPHWARLLLWPQHLLADYSPPAFDRAVGFGPLQALGAALLVTGAVILWRTWTRHRAIAFGLALTVIALSPVSNTIAVSAILLAERTLYLPSVGVVLALAGMASLVARGPRPLRLALGAIAAVALGAGAWSSAARQAVWRDNATVFATLVRDAPTNYRGHWLWARHLVTEGRNDDAIIALERAADLYPHDPVVFEDLGQLLRATGQCSRALLPFTQALNIDSSRTIARSRLVQCLLETGDLAEARRIAAAGLAQGITAFGAAIDRIDSLTAAATGVP